MGTTATRSVALAVFAAVALVACTTDSSSSGRSIGDATARSERADPGSAGSPEWLFSVQADGESTYDAATGRLSIPAGAVQAFTDRPYRDSRVISTQAFANLFHQGGRDSFEKDPPNAVLTYWDDSSGTPTPRSVVCEVSGGAGVSDGGLWVGLEVLEPAGVTLPARLDRAALFVDDVATAGCPIPPDAQTIVEYFNQIAYDSEVTIGFQVDGPDYELSLSCPPALSPTIPPPNMEIRMSTSGGASTVTCNSGTISVPVATTDALPFCQGTGCVFEITVLDSESGYVFSTTEFTLQMEPEQPSVIVPQLQPATLPLCSLGPPDCLLTGTCTQSSSGPGQLELCQDPASCGAGPY